MALSKPKSLEKVGSIQIISTNKSNNNKTPNFNNRVNDINNYNT